MNKLKGIRQGVKMLKNIASVEFDSLVDSNIDKLTKTEQMLAGTVKLVSYHYKDKHVANKVITYSESVLNEIKMETCSADPEFIRFLEGGNGYLSSIKLTNNYGTFVEMKNEVLKFEEELRIYDDIPYSSKFDAATSIRERAESSSGIKERLTYKENDTYYDNTNYIKDYKAVELMDYTKVKEDLVSSLDLELNVLLAAKEQVLRTKTLEETFAYLCTHETQPNKYLDSTTYYNNVLRYLNAKLEDYSKSEGLKYISVKAGIYVYSPNKIVLTVTDRTKHTTLHWITFDIDVKQVIVNRKLHISISGIDFVGRLSRLHLDFEKTVYKLEEAQKELSELSLLQKSFGKHRRINESIDLYHENISSIYDGVLYFKKLLADVDSDFESKSLRIDEVLQEQKKVMDYLGDLTQTEIIYSEGFEVV